MSRVPDLHHVDLPESRPSAPMTVGVIGLIVCAYGALRLLLLVFAYALARTPNPMSPTGELLEAGPLTIAVLLVQTIVLAVASIGLVCYARWGRTAFYIYVGVACFAIAVKIATRLDAMSAIDDESLEGRLSAAQQWDSATITTAAIGSLLFPIIGLIFLSRPAVGRSLK